MRSFVVVLTLASVIGCVLVDGTAWMNGFSSPAGAGRTDPWNSVQLAWDPQEEHIEVEGPKKDAGQAQQPTEDPNAVSALWVQTNGPTGGIIMTIEIDPRDPDTLYAGGSGGAVFRSENAGATWTMLDQIAPPSHQISHIVLFPEAMVVLVSGQLRRSNDRGETWTELDAPTWFTCIAGASVGGGPVLAAGGPAGNVYRSDDLGSTWRDASRGLP